MCVFFVSTSSHYKNNSTTESRMCISLHVKYLLFLPDFNETWTFSTDFRKIVTHTHTHIQFHENTLNGSRIVPRGGTDRRTDMTKLILAFRNFANAPKMASLFSTGFTPGRQGRSHMQSKRKLCTAFLRLQVEMSIFRQFTESKTSELPESLPKEKLSTT